MLPNVLKHLLISVMAAVLIVSATLLTITVTIFYLKRWLLEIANSLLKRATRGKQGKLIQLLQVIFEGSKVEEETSGFYAVPLLNRGEQQLYHRLVEAIPDHIILAEVAYSQFLKHKDFSEFSRMKQKVPDFVVCDSEFNVITIIELDGPTHDSKKEKDQERDGNAAEAGIKTVRWHVSKLPDRAEIRWKVLGLKTDSDGQDATRWAPR